MISRTRRAWAYSLKVRPKIREYSSRRSVVDFLMSSSPMESRSDAFEETKRAACNVIARRRFWGTIRKLFFALRDEPLLLREPANHLKGHGLARREYSRRRRRAVGRNENAAVFDIEKDAERSAVMNYTGDRDEVVLAGHRISEVRIIRAFASQRCLAVGAVPYGSRARSLRTGKTSVVSAVER